MIVAAGQVVGVGVLGRRVLARGGRWLAVGLVVGVWWLLVWGVAAAPPALTPVAGSPFVTGSGPISVAFSPSGGLLATANYNADTVSVFSVAAGGALTPVAGSPFATGSRPGLGGVQPFRRAARDRQLRRQTVSVFSVGSRRRVDRGGLAVCHRARPGLGGVQPFGGLLATANSGAGSVSVFAVGSGGALTQVSGLPVRRPGSAPMSVAFSPGGGLLATANYDANTVSVFAVGSRRRADPGHGLPV